MIMKYCAAGITFTLLDTLNVLTALFTFYASLSDVDHNYVLAVSDFLLLQLFSLMKWGFCLFGLVFLSD